MPGFVRPHRTRASDLKPQWHVIDAEGKTLGRLGSEIATLLQGKHNPMYVAHMNTGDFVVVVNAEKVRVTGNKLDKKMYYRHSGYHGGLKEQTLSDVLARTPTRVLKQAVKGMLPKNSVGRQMLSRLKLYAGSEHPHEAQVNAGSRTTDEAPAGEASAAVKSESEATALEKSPVANVAAAPAEETKPKRSKAASDDQDSASVSETEKKPKARSRQPKATATDAAAEGSGKIEAKAAEDSKPAKAESSDDDVSEKETTEKTQEGEEA